MKLASEEGDPSEILVLEKNYHVAENFIYTLTKEEEQKSVLEQKPDF